MVSMRLFTNEQESLSLSPNQKAFTALRWMGGGRKGQAPSNLPSTFTSMSSNRPPAWLMVSELGECTGPGPLSDTCGPATPPFDIGTVIGQPGTDILLNETLMMWSHVSAGTNETVNLSADGAVVWLVAKFGERHRRC